MTATATGPDPLHVVVIGAGVGGLGTALACSRAGLRVTVIERDATPTPTDPDSAFEWDRRGAPQVRHSHALLARLHNLLRDHYPDVLQALFDAGATEMRFCDNPPPEMEDREPREGDEDLVAIACRRTTFEWVLRRIVLAEDHVTLLDGVTVDGFTADVDPDTGRPTVTGVHVTRDGEPDTIGADAVVAATGRRSGVPRWLEPFGVELETVEEDTGIIYLSRFYRWHDGAEPPELNGPIGGDLGYLKYAVFAGDNRTYSVTFAIRTHDDELRAQLLDPERFDEAARFLPATAPWAASDLSDAITPVHVMGGLLNRRIRFRDREGAPLVLGFHAVGDAHTCSNPLYGRGCSLAMVQAQLLADALVAHPGATAGELVARAEDYEAGCAAEVEPWYRAAVAQDRFAREQARKEREAEADAGTAPSSDEASDERVDTEVESQPEFVAELMRDGLLPAVRTDPVVFRAFIRAFNLLQAPDSLMNDADVIGRVLTVYQDRENRPPEPSLGPPRDAMLDRLRDLAPAS